MKTLFMGLAIVLGLYLALNYMKTGELGFGSSSMSEVEREIKRLEDRLADAERSYRVAGRGAAVGGMEGTSGAEAALGDVRFVEREIARVKPRVSSEPEKQRLKDLEERLKQVKSQMGVR